MYKYLFTSILLLGSMTAVQAQSKLSWGVEAGLNLSHPIDATSVAPGFNASVFGRLDISKVFFLDAAVRYNYKPWIDTQSIENGSTWDPNMLYMTVKETASPSTLELPIHAGFSFGLSDKLALNVGLGPYFGVGLGGKVKIKDVYVDLDNVESVEKRSYDVYGKNDFKRFEVGADARIGLEFMRHYNVSVGYQFQFNDRDAIHFGVGKAQTFSINLGYRF